MPEFVLKLVLLLTNFMLNLFTLRSDLFRTDATLRQELFEITAPNYEDASQVMEREFAHCDTLYLARDSDGKIACFFLAAWETLDTPEGELPTIYLGLSAARTDAKAYGLTGLLYYRCLNEATEWESANGRRLILWGTTASPIVYLSIHTFLAATEPYLDGNYSPMGAKLAQAFRCKMTLTESGNSHPFVLKSVATGTRYSPLETERIQQVCQERNFSLFRELGIDEPAGDRLLFIARTPDRAL